MGKGSVAQVSQDIASREVFQGLFKDLGKQAMALEAILRAVCGRVDKLENWLTEVSFGMTELDLKLRNIAHNIDGTGAVDDEVTGPMRWAIPPTEQVKPLAPTVSKKLGADKKGVRVTGMAAAILDRLTTTTAAPTAPIVPNIGVDTAINPTESIPAQTAPTLIISDVVDTSEDSDESASEGSSSGSSSSSGEDDDPDIDDAEAGAAVEEISKAMTALKKLKHAHMLSPEEEKQLKERAHKKWFQLKGQIKEKQKKDVTNILLKRKKNVFTVSSRIELLEEKSREIFAALKQFTNEMRDKSDRAAHEILRRRVADIEHSLQSIDVRFASLPVPATEKVNDFTVEVDSLRNTMQLQLMTAQDEATARHAYLEVALSNQRTLIESMAQDVPVQLNAQAELFTEKLKQIPDYSVAIENLKRSLRRKADLKLLKDLMNINATRAILSPDRPISAPVVPQKKKANSAARGKSLLKSLSTQLDPPQ
ncbi:hypothetical protein BBJ29_004626 [Phytophthora kernoviae]|uniref:Uncharacterized protein n=1 Tax=Phytophthora kernoviae TaxID=325452 RepID=A0A3F2RZ48_9STRA|nr:hypothetical protein BBJ29_004626 [Phytophthora kernoviae]RLN66237.1 hypothetical protein BBP00_00002344 [Phytophthora kernoviae]